ncbi:MAG TPA: FtsX-like permease family protein [Solirubrobacteraceae bacterium]|jgi:putative ABC transport system permease protein|nr:FtsX-like permease family protein [Solirubrobacteraceae bacterium]
MRFSSIVRLYRVRLRARLTQELFAVLGIAIGVALLFASQVANTSLDGSVQRLTNGIVGQMRFQIASRDSHGFDESLMSRVAKLPGVQAVAPVLEQNANVVGPSGERSVDLVGTDPRLARFGGSIARHVGSVPLGKASVFTLSATIARSIGVNSIQSVGLQIGSTESKALLVTQLFSGSEASLGESPIALASLGTVQRLSGLEGRLTSIYVRSPPRLDKTVRAELERVAAGRLNVRPADITTALFRRAAGPVDQSTGLFSALSALVGFLFAFNALMLTVPQRRSLIEDLRLDGYTRRMIVQVLGLDALVLGVIASAFGLLLGEVLSVGLFSSNPGYLSFAFPIGTERIVTWSSVVLAVLGGLLAAGTGVLVPLRAAITERPMRIAQTSGTTARRRSQWLLSLAIVCLAATTAILLAAPQAAIVGVFSLTAALLLCLPALLDLAIRGWARLQHLITDAATYLALIELRSRPNRARSLAIAATGAIAVFGSVAIEGARGSLERGLDASTRGTDSRADIWIAPGGTSNALVTTPFKDVAAEALARLPGVRSVRLYRGSFLDWRERRIWVLAQPRADTGLVSASQLVSGDLGLADARLHSNGWVVLSRAIADEHDLHVGDAFTLPTPQPMTFRVAALSTNLGWPPGAAIMNADDYARAWGSLDPSAYQLDVSRGAATAAVKHEAEATLGSQSGMRVETAEQRERLHYSQAAQGLSRLSQIRSLVLIAAVLAMAAAMGAMIWQRRVRLADMKVDGFGRLVLWRALLWESAILLGSGCALGAVFGLFGQLLLTRALSVVTGFPVIESAPLGAAVSSFVLITAVAVAIVAVPGYAAARVRPTVGMPE